MFSFWLNRNCSNGRAETKDRLHLTYRTDETIPMLTTYDSLSSLCGSGLAEPDR